MVPWTKAVWSAFASLQGPSAAFVAVSVYGVARPLAVSAAAGTVIGQFGFGVAAGGGGGGGRWGGASRPCRGGTAGTGARACGVRLGWSSAVRRIRVAVRWCRD